MTYKVVLNAVEFERVQQAVYSKMEEAERTVSKSQARQDWDRAHEWLNLHKKISEVKPTPD